MSSSNRSSCPINSSPSRARSLEPGKDSSIVEGEISDIGEDIFEILLALKTLASIKLDLHDQAALHRRKHGFDDRDIRKEHLAVPWFIKIGRASCRERVCQYV